ncbi:MAG: TonB-dependent receptor [Prevotellaceae bacterium]|jgi:TonB-linked SusC/RagA family outer membrane protein|nr:TonB-dependent receptor [Prevotellaceae bacterium]
MKKVLLFFVCLLATGLSASWAQTGQVSGVVTENGQPLAGASVAVKGSTTAVLTAVDGRYTITVPENAVLVFSFVGMKTQEITAGSRSVINVALEAEATRLEDVVVVAYGTTTRERFTGSAAVIKGEKLAKGETSNLTKALEGAIAGVQTTSSTGQPGSDANIRVRGIGSISAGSNPLIVVDGVPYEGSLNSIAPQDIETLNVLKDASATSMYGARGSNGVIMITTKKGETGKVKVNFDARMGVNSRGVPAYNVITSPQDYYELTWEALRNNLMEGGMGAYVAGQTVSNDLIPVYLRYNIFKGVADGDLVNPITGKINPAATERKWSDNWLKDPFKNNIRQEYSFNMSGGTENTNAYMSVGYINDKGYIDKSDFSRINVRGKIDQKFKDFFKAGVNMAYAQTTANEPISSAGNSNFENIFMFSQNIAPIYPIYKYDLATGQPVYTDNIHAYDFGSGNFENGKPSARTRPYAAEQNPLFVLQNDYTRTIYDNLSSRAYGEIKFLEDFTFTVNIAYDIFNATYNEYTNPIVGDGKSYNGSGSRISERYTALNANQLLNYSKEIDRHKINVLLGHEIKMDEVTSLEGSKTQFYDPYNPELANAGAVNTLTSFVGKYRLEGFLSRAEYSYDSKYMLSGSFRRDASSRFHPDVRWGNFWSVGAAWRIKEEWFLKDIDQIDNLRLRVSYGTQGNDNISGYNLYEDQYTITSDGKNPSPVLTFRGAPNLTWEKSNNLTIGLESKLFDRITLNIDYFIKETKDMIYRKPLPPSLGTPTWVWDNQIDMTNSGWEIELNVDILKTENISWNVSANITSLSNKLTKLPADKAHLEGYRSGSYWRKLGGSLYDFYLPKYAGVDETTGKALWYKDDANGNKVTTDNHSAVTFYEIGKTAIPDCSGGLSTELTAYGFDLSLQTAFVLGGYAYDSSYGSLMGSGNDIGQNWHTDIYARWTPTNRQANTPRLSSGDQNVSALSDRFLASASYFSLKNVTLGYTFPKSIIDKVKIRSLRIYASGDNLWLASARKGFDPRQSFSGATYIGIYSALRSISVGVSIGL